MAEFPDELSALNLRAYLQNNFGVCSCAELDEVIAVLRHLLEWHELRDRPSYTAVFTAPLGVYYLLAGRLDRLGLAEHGTSIRHPWLTERGKRLLAALQHSTPEAIEGAAGEAYDGCYYPAYEE